ncbi:MAG: 2-oxo acid dehydrogenase subunit E2 [Clostridia bacterium]|nr:2-oxo acid dehydrogenase subunit E2 [Clostridia bacterium]
MTLKEYMKAARLSPDKEDRIEYMTMSDKMVSNAFVNGQRNSPSVCGTYDANATKFMEVFNKLKSECGYKLTLNTVVIKILIEGLKSTPRLNAHYKYNHTSTSGELIIKKHINVSMAICKSDGTTFQMKLQNLEDKTLEEIALIAADARKRLETSELDEVMFEVSRQRVIGELSKGRIVSPLYQSLSASFGKRKVVHLSKTLKSDFLKIIGKKDLQPDCDVKIEELNEGTVCFTNWGAICDNSNFNIVSGPLLYPQVFLFSMGRLREEKCVYEDENGNLRLGTKQILPFGLNFDHKIGGAYELTPFIKKLDEIFENPEIMYSW